MTTCYFAVGKSGLSNDLCRYPYSDCFPSFPAGSRSVPPRHPKLLCDSMSICDCLKCAISTGRASLRVGM